MNLRTCLAVFAIAVIPLVPSRTCAAEADGGSFVSGSTAASGRLIQGMPDFAATESFLARMRRAFPEPQPDGKGFSWPAPAYLDVESLAHAASRDEMSHSEAGNYGAFLAQDARHHAGDIISVASCTRPSVDGHVSPRPYMRRWEYRWHAEGTPGWQPEKMQMERVEACPPPGRKAA